MALRSSVDRMDRGPEFNKQTLQNDFDQAKKNVTGQVKEGMKAFRKFPKGSPQRKKYIKYMKAVTPALNAYGEKRTKLKMDAKDLGKNPTQVALEKLHRKIRKDADAIMEVLKKAMALVPEKPEEK